MLTVIVTPGTLSIAVGVGQDIFMWSVLAGNVTLMVEVGQLRNVGG